MLYLDLDGCFADFDGQLVKYGVIKNDQTFHHTHPSTWTEAQTELSHKVEKCMGTKGFWEGIPLCKGAYELWDFCQQYNPIILTAVPSKLDWKDLIVKEKQSWIDRYFGVGTPVRYCFRSEKKDYCKKLLDVLLDDTKQNISEWHEAGGIGILHTDIESSIRKIRFIYEEVH